MSVGDANADHGPVPPRRIGYRVSGHGRNRGPRVHPPDLGPPIPPGRSGSTWMAITTPTYRVLISTIFSFPQYPRFLVLLYGRGRLAIWAVITRLRSAICLSPLPKAARSRRTKPHNQYYHIGYTKFPEDRRVVTLRESFSPGRGEGNTASWKDPF